LRHHPRPKSQSQRRANHQKLRRNLPLRRRLRPKKPQKMQPQLRRSQKKLRNKPRKQNQLNPNLRSQLKLKLLNE